MACCDGPATSEKLLYPAACITGPECAFAYMTVLAGDGAEPENDGGRPSKEPTAEWASCMFSSEEPLLTVREKETGNSDGAGSIADHTVRSSTLPGKKAPQGI